MESRVNGLRLLLLLHFIFLFASHHSFGQSQTTLLIISNQPGKVLFDGEAKGDCIANVPFKIITSGGEHYAQVQLDNGAKDKGQIINLEEGKQKILKIEFASSVTSTPVNTTVTEIKIADLNFAIPGLTSVGAWKNANPGFEYPYPAHFIAFEKGDEIVLNTSMTNKKGKNLIEIRTYPGNALKYSNRSFTELQDLRIRVDERSVYQITLATNHIFDRNCLMSVARKPSSSEYISFNPNVSKQMIFKTVSIVEPASQFINSGSNASLLGGKSRILIPVNVPPNTVEWFYRFSASRSKEDIENVRKNFKLFGELTNLLLTASGAGTLATGVVDIGVEQLSMPPGSAHCDVFLINYDNIANFEAKADGNWQYIIEGTRTNLKSGNVKVTCCNAGQWYLGIRNPATYDGINVSVEVIAITATEDYVMEQK